MKTLDDISRNLKAIFDVINRADTPVTNQVVIYNLDRIDSTLQTIEILLEDIKNKLYEKKE